MLFENLGLAEPILRAVGEEGYTKPTPIQALAIPHIVQGRDLLGCAQTGTGKTAAFALPILTRLLTAPAGQAQGDHRRIRALILSPTRELAAQIGDSFKAYGRHAELRYTVVYGGVRQGPQVKEIKRGVDILVATPGRLLDLMGQGFVKIDAVSIFVLDEADRMLDMGFIQDIRRIIAKLPRERQTLLLSATIPGEIRALADALLNDPVEVRVTPESPAAETVDQCIYLVERNNKQPLLQYLLKNEEITRALVFTRTKYGADRVAASLKQVGIEAWALHSDKPQHERQRVMDGFRNGKIPILIASDIAARGIDVDDISHVINYDMPHEPETYVHRIGRTGRAGAAGKAFSFCALEERILLDAVEKLLGKTLPAVVEHPFPSPLPRRSLMEPQPAAAATGSGWKRPIKRNLLSRRRR